jgi:hypothetical protein
MEEEDFETQDDAPGQRYDVVITGMRSGVERGEFLRHLAASLKTTTATLEPLFLPSGLTVKRSSDYATASKYVSVLREWNCICKMVRSDAPAPSRLLPPSSREFVQKPVIAERAHRGFKQGWIVFTILATLGVSYARLHELQARFAGSGVPSVAAGQQNLETASGSSPSPVSQTPGKFDLEIVRSKGFAHDSMSEVVTAATAVSEGGFIASTSSKPNTFLYRISKNGDVVWRDDLSLQNETITSVGESPAGGYWIAGQTPDATGTPRDFTQRVSLEGKLSGAVILSSVSDNRLLHCVVDAGAGFVQIGSVESSDAQDHFPVPAISMTTDTGDRVWEHPVPVDQGRRLRTSAEGPFQTNMFTCAGVASDKSGKVIAAQRIQEVSDDKGTGDSYGTLVVALDPQGHELGRVRHENVVGATLIGTPGGAVLRETPYVRREAPQSPTNNLLNAVKVPDQTDARLHMYTFDYSLKETRPVIVFAGTQLDSVDAGLLTSEGGLLITGCPADGSARYLLYIDPSGAMSPIRKFEQLGENCGGLYQLSKAENSGEAMLLAQTPQQGNRLFSIKYLSE